MYSFTLTEHAATAYSDYCIQRKTKEPAIPDPITRFIIAHNYSCWFNPVDGVPGLITISFVDADQADDFANVMADSIEAEDDLGID